MPQQNTSSPILAILSTAATTIMPLQKGGRALRYSYTLMLLCVLVSLTTPLPATAQDDPDLDQAAAAQAIIDALPSLLTYDSYVLETRQFITYSARIETPDGEILPDRYDLQITVRDEVKASGEPDQRVLRRSVDRVTIRDGREVGRTLGEWRVVNAIGYFNVISTGDDRARGWGTDGWQAYPQEEWATQPYSPLFLRPYGDRGDLLATDAAQRGYGVIGQATLRNLTSVDDILSSIDELRVQEGRFVDGGAVTFYRLLGDGLADVVSASAPFDQAVPALGPLLAAGIRDVTVALVIDAAARVRSQIVAYNLNIQNADALLFTDTAGTYSLQMSVNTVEQFIAVNGTVTVNAPNVD